jgi:hypothetical protein
MKKKAQEPQVELPKSGLPNVTPAVTVPQIDKAALMQEAKKLVLEDILKLLPDVN